MEARFNAGSVVQIKTTGEVVTISAVTMVMGQAVYIVFQNGKRFRYRESDLVSYIDREAALWDDLQTGCFADGDAFRTYAYYRLFSENQSGNLYSYQGNKLIFNPFQYKPLMKFLSIDSDERLLIADEVGVGKTIESGIILDELTARGELRERDTVLIVCPSVLCRKWYAELKDRFSMDDYYIHDGSTLNYMLDALQEGRRNPYPHSIVSEQLVRGEQFQQKLNRCLEILEEPFLQFLIVDECHHYRNPGTNTHKVGVVLSMCSERVLMLSATPYNLRSNDLYHQLHMLNPSLFPDEQLFSKLLDQIRCVNQSVMLVHQEGSENRRRLLRCLEKLYPVAERNSFLFSDFERLCHKILEGDSLHAGEKAAFEQIVSMLNPIATSFTRTLKRDALEHRVTRETMTLEVRFTPQEAEVYRSFLETNLMRYKMFGVSERAFGLLINGLERIAASSIPALEHNIKHYLNMPDEELTELLWYEAEADRVAVANLKAFLQESYASLMEKIHLVGDNDSKYAVLRQLIEKMRTASAGNKRVIVFSFYTQTLKYLRRRLTADGYSVGLMFGQTPADTPAHQIDDEGFPVRGRNDLMNDFESGGFDILLVSEVGGEGLDFQFCNCLINYDLPYNPMRIEQRIGRIDRMGQTADKIMVGSLCIADTIDMVIERVLLQRIDSAADLVGELEPVISRELAKLNELVITGELTTQELSRREAELEQRIEKARQTREEFEQARYELVNDKGFRDEFEDSVRRSRITPQECLLFTLSYLRQDKGCKYKKLSDSAACIHLSQNLRTRLSKYAKRMNLGKAGEELEKLVARTDDSEIDFNGDAAYAHKERIFVKPAGAFIHFMIDDIKSKEVSELENVFCAGVKKNRLSWCSSGRYWLFIYEMVFKGFRESTSYEYFLASEDGATALCLDDEQKKELLQSIEKKNPENINLNGLEVLCAMVENLVEERKETIVSEATGRNNVKIGSRIQGLRSLCELRISSLKDGKIYSENGEKLNNRIQRERKKTEERIAVLESKMKYVGSYSLDAICLVDVL